MYDLADEYDAWLDRLDALNAERIDVFDPWTGERIDETEQEYYDRCPENDAAAEEWYQPADADAPTPPAAPLPPRIFNAAALDKLRAARDNADFMLSVAFAHGYKYPHRSHRHQRGEES